MIDGEFAIKIAIFDGWYILCSPTGGLHHQLSGGRGFSGSESGGIVCRATVVTQQLLCFVWRVRKYHINIYQPALQENQMLIGFMWQFNSLQGVEHFAKRQGEPVLSVVGAARQDSGSLEAADVQRWGCERWGPMDLLDPAVLRWPSCIAARFWKSNFSICDVSPPPSHQGGSMAESFPPWGGPSYPGGPWYSVPLAFFMTPCSLLPRCNNEEIKHKEELGLFICGFYSQILKEQGWIDRNHYRMPFATCYLLIPFALSYCNLMMFLLLRYARCTSLDCYFLATLMIFDVLTILWYTNVYNWFVKHVMETQSPVVKIFLPQELMVLDAPKPHGGVPIHSRSGLVWMSTVALDLISAVLVRLVEATHGFY